MWKNVQISQTYKESFETVSKVEIELMPNIYDIWGLVHFTCIISCDI